MDLDRPDADCVGLPCADGLCKALDDACVIALTDFAAAVAGIRTVLAAETTSGVLRYIDQQYSLPNPGQIVCVIYLLVQAHSADLAADAGWHALELGCDDDGVIIALADVLQ
ncbi:MAG: hypothetical protein JO212_18905 [Acetobacteraceae bacterium]|nr:hypothetical protein [Acetobacteraceae bacterium]